MPKTIEEGLLQSKMNGMALVASPNAYEKNPMPPLQDLGINWISIQPFIFFYKDQPHLHKGTYQWWGHRKEGIIETVQLAKKAGIKVLLKPQLWAYNQWIGDLEFSLEKDWKSFEEDYRVHMLSMAHLADSLGVDMLSVGTEVKRAARLRPEFWRSLIQEIRMIYQGKLIYASNWDAYQDITFWDALDCIGINAYFPVSKHKTPQVEHLKKVWQPTVDSIRTFQEKWQRPIVFTEFGYMSLDGCAYKAWLLEKKATEVRINETAQANALQAVLETFGQEDWWAGGFQWKWYPNLNASLSDDAAARDYTPQGKKAMKIIQKLCK